MGRNNPWLCTCGKTNTGPACPNCGRMDESASQALRKGGEDASSMRTANSLGIGWVTGSSSRFLVKGCWIYVMLFIALPIVASILNFLFANPRR